jgi:hypothetical protein
VSRRRRAFLLGLLLVDVPVLAACSIAGLRYGFADTFAAVLAWRLAHPWAGLPSLVASAVLVSTSRPVRRLLEHGRRPELTR